MLKHSPNGGSTISNATAVSTGADLEPHSYLSNAMKLCGMPSMPLVVLCYIAFAIGERTLLTRGQMEYRTRGG
jgi:hypothetical protein